MNRGNLRDWIFEREVDNHVIEWVLLEALQIYQLELYNYQVMPNHYHLVLRLSVDGELSRFSNMS